MWPELTNKKKIMSDVNSRVVAIIVDKLGVDESEVTAEADYSETQKIRNHVASNISTLSYYWYVQKTYDSSGFLTIL